MFEEGSTYYIRVRGRVQGPFDLEQLKKLRQRGQFSRAHEVSPDQATWQSASILDPVFVAPKRPAPAKVEPVVEEFAEEPVATPKTPALSTKPVWHYTVGEEQYGPVTLLELRKLVASGEVMQTDLVWKEGMLDWTAVIDLDELNPSHSDSSSKFAPSNGIQSGSSERQYAGFWFRFFAYLIDTLITVAVSFLLSLILEVILRLGFSMSLLTLFDRPSDSTQTDVFNFARLMSEAVVLFVNFMLQWLYFAFMESSAHRATVGKLACGIVVTGESGAPVTFGQATGRYFAKIISNATLGIGYLMCVWTNKEQCLHDKIASCLVVKR